MKSDVTENDTELWAAILEYAEQYGDKGFNDEKSQEMMETLDRARVALGMPKYWTVDDPPPTAKE